MRTPAGNGSRHSSEARRGHGDGMNIAWRIYRRLAQAFPHEFKLAYGADMMQLGEDSMEEIAKRHGAAGLIRLIADIAIRVPIEYLSEMRQRHALRGARADQVARIRAGRHHFDGPGNRPDDQRVQPAMGAAVSAICPPRRTPKSLVMPEKPVSYHYIEQYPRAKKAVRRRGRDAEWRAVQRHVAGQTETRNRSASSASLFRLIIFQCSAWSRSADACSAPALTKPGDAPVVVISDRFWRDRLNSSPDCGGANTSTERPDRDHRGNHAEGF